MGAFFRGWRRKLGCVLLTMAGAFTAGWIRSMYLSELAGWTSAKSFLPIHVYSCDSTIFLAIKSGWNFSLCWPTWETFPFGGPVDFVYDATVTWLFSSYGIGYATFADEDFLMVPYWMIVMPLTLLSAYFILCPKKRSGRTPKESATL